MPHLFSFAGHGSEQEQQCQQQVATEDLSGKRPRRLSDFKKSLGGIWRRHQEPGELMGQGVSEERSQSANQPVPQRRGSLPDTNAHRRVVPSLPRPQTFRRQESERRVNLLEVPEGSLSGRRAQSEGRQRGLSASAARRSSPPKPLPLPSTSAPNVACQDHQPLNETNDTPSMKKDDEKSPISHRDLPPLKIPDGCDVEANDDEDEEPDIDRNALEEEYDQRWILNLSMHFRDKSNREKFFVTYAQTPNKWRRLTVSLDYRNSPPDSLEEDLGTLVTQRDKSFRIYEAIRESLPEIQYYNTVTNLKLETEAADGQLHVHVREDANEIINYPPIELFDHVRTERYCETDIEFISHLSGFVYKVNAGGRTLIKKEIPGPDTVDEFLYEVNALDALIGSRNVVQLEGLVTDESGYCVKGLLISYASRGALVDMLYDYRSCPDEPTQLPWHRREKWALQIVRGLADIHEAGFVQGDFTLSNIVIDEDDTAQIIDVNRRGCPVGWEPPELGRLIDSGQRIGMCIGVKTDLFQLGMVLWALAEEVDEPERVERPLPPIVETVPAYFRRIVETCLSRAPQGRQSAKRLVHRFPPTAGLPPPPGRPSVDFAAAQDVTTSEHSLSTSHRSDKEYIDPAMAVTLEDVNSRHRRRNTDVSHFTSGQVTYVDPRDPESNPASTSYAFGSSGSWIVPRRGRERRRRSVSPFGVGGDLVDSSVTSLSRSASAERSPPSRSRRRCGSESSAEGEKDGRREDIGMGKEERRGEEEHQVGFAGLEEKGPEVVEILEPRPDAQDEGESQREVEAEEYDPPPASDTTFLDRRLAALRRGYEGGSEMSPLLHTDSGFDECMVEEIELGPPVVGDACDDSAPDVGNAHRDEVADVPDVGTWDESQQQHIAPETPGSFHTPKAMVEDPLAKTVVPPSPPSLPAAEETTQPSQHEVHQDTNATREPERSDRPIQAQGG